MDEFEFIKTCLAPLAGPEGLKLQDDAAVMTPLPGLDLILATDTMVEGVHFPNGHYGGDTAERLLRVNLSDLAAKTGRPVGYLLSIAWPKNVSAELMQGFASGLRDVQKAYDFRLYGGDTVSTSGPMVVTATLIGVVPEGQMVKRAEAQAGDDIWVTGSIGDACLGLKYVTGHDITPVPDGEALWLWEEAYLRPQPRLLIRKLLRKYASASIDVSDGLLADIGHITTASKLGCKIYTADVPLSAPTQKWLSGQGDSQKAIVELVTAGDDYEIVFTASPDHKEDIAREYKNLGVHVACIGQCMTGNDVTLLDPNNKSFYAEPAGYKHF
ncbi:MAG: thiamine-phosphate kinase [Hyphomonadaceae bacterium]|nr:thiamine-phosphate kinase [Hyphomonadaceae bacterium]